jgi:hypothetical protein
MLFNYFLSIMSYTDETNLAAGINPVKKLGLLSSIVHTVFNTT